MWKSDKQRRWGHTAEGLKALGGKKAVAEWDSASKTKKKKVKPKIVVNNHIKAYGQTDTDTGVVEINKKKHRGDKRQLTDTIKHEIFHVKHPQATEKQTYKATGKLSDITPQEEQHYLSKLRMKKINYKVGVVKRKLHLKGDTKPGDLISKANESKITRTTNQPIPRKEKVSIMGAV